MSQSFPHLFPPVRHDARASSARPCSITRVVAEDLWPMSDVLAVEEPLEIRVMAAGQERRVTVTMRTPGADAELALGFLLSEGVIGHVADVTAIRPCPAQSNLLRVELMDHCAKRLDGIARNFVATSSCGVCGRTSLEAVAASVPSTPVPARELPISAAVLRRIPARLRASQAVFDRTGGLHAVAAFAFTGELVSAFEDIGRHNAFDKLIGAAALAGEPDLQHHLVALSGRAGFELVQKAAMARVPVLAAIGAPSSLAVELAERSGITLVGFLRATGFNVYTHAERLLLETALAGEEP